MPDDFEAVAEAARLNWLPWTETKLACLKREENKRKEHDPQFRMLGNDKRLDIIILAFKLENVTTNRDGLKRKWASMKSDFSKINDYQKRSGCKNWWDMTTMEKKIQPST